MTRKKVSQPDRPKQRIMRATQDDVAALAGVSIATVDRVLNERGDVSNRTTKKVIQAARQLKLRRTLPKAYRRAIRIEVILARPDSEYFQRLNEAFIIASAGLDHSIKVERTFFDESQTDLYVDKITSRNTDGVVLYCAHENAAIIRAINEATASGKPIVTITGDITQSNRLAHIGIDNNLAGKTAAYLLSKMVAEPGKVLLLRHSEEYRGQKERVLGFVDQLNNLRPDIQIAEILNGKDQPNLSRRLVTQALERHSDVVGLYCTGAGRQAAGDALNAAGLGGRVIYIAHELTKHSRVMLDNGTLALIIDQNPEQQAYRAIKHLLSWFGYVEDFEHSTVPFTLITPLNVPEIKA